MFLWIIYRISRNRYILLHRPSSVILQMFKKVAGKSEPKNKGNKRRKCTKKYFVSLFNEKFTVYKMCNTKSEKWIHLYVEHENLMTIKCLLLLEVPEFIFNH